MMRKKLVVAILCILLMFGSTACGAGSDEERDVNSSVPTSDIYVEVVVPGATPSESGKVSEDFDSETSQEVNTSTGKVPELAYQSYQVELDYDLVKELPEVPALSELEDAINSEQVPKVFQSIYNKKAIAGELDEDNLVAFCINYKEAFPVLYEDDIYSFDGIGVFQNEGTLVLTAVDNRTAYFLSISPDGKKTRDSFFLDYDEAEYPNLELLGSTSWCSVCYDTNTSQFVCMRDGKEAGERVDVSLREVLDLKEEIAPSSSYSFCLGYVDRQNQFIYPIMQKSSNGISFQLYKVGPYTEEADTSRPHFYSADTSNGVRYKVYNSVFYTLPNDCVDHFSAMGRCIVACVNTESVKISEHHIDFSKLTNVTLGSGDGWEDVSAYQGDICLWGSYKSNGCDIDEMIENNLFEEYIQQDNIFSDRMHEDTGLNFQSTPTYFCSDWNQASKIIEYSNTNKISSP